MKIDIEKEFHHIVRDMGGIVLSDVLPKSPSFNNADYVFHDQKIVAELECLEEDKYGDPSTARRIFLLWGQWRTKGWVTGPLPRVITSETLPRQCANEMIRAMGKSIRKRLEKANRQIKSTILNMELDGYKGIVIIANNNNRALPPAALVQFLYDAIHRDFSAIDEFITFTTTLPAGYGKDNAPMLFWFNGHIAERYRSPG